MDTERTCLELLLRKVNFEDIELEQDEKSISYRRIGENKFVKIAKSVLKQYSGDEIFQLYRWLNQKLLSDCGSSGVFAYIADTAEKFLEIKEGNFLCREYLSVGGSVHELQLLRWRELSVSMGNEIFMAALMAKGGSLEKYMTDLLCTPFPTFDQDYKKKLGLRNLAENHFHLKGSIPVFTLNWVCLMNHIGEISHNFFVHFNRYLEPDILYDETRQKSLKLAQSCRQAAYYRMYLYHRLDGNEAFLSSHIFQNLFLEEEDLSELQEQINVCRSQYTKITGVYGGQYEELECLDYAAGTLWEQFRKELRDEAAVAGERNFLYQCFRAVFEDKFTYAEKNMFYRYLVIGMRVRAELVQVNGNRGFSNFAEYQLRKEDFIEDYDCFKRHIMKLAVKSTFSFQSLSDMELRITPKSCAATWKQIEEYDSVMCGSDLKHFYVLHIPKKADNSYMELKPRNYILRDSLKESTEEAYALLEREWTDYEYLGKIPRVRGYDTCSGEIGCRPEVFAQFYRQLQDYNNRRGLEQVHFTYHVGEDFLDILSGLRAVDEAVRFCGLPAHSRIGHGMVLGIDAKAYYSMKKNCSVLEKQEILDNIAWVLGFCKEQGISVEPEVKKRLSGLFSAYLNEIYVSKEQLPEEAEEAQQEAAAAKEEVIDSTRQAEYYDAWKLRGDDPYFYIEEGDIAVNDQLGLCGIREGKELENIRQQKKCRNYYRAYHFDQSVREKGSQADIWQADCSYYPLITRIQEELRHILTEEKIAVECNPSSNYKIGPFERYEDHPMLRMYGKNLSSHPSSRMNVSINTDDQGVFHTSLEMEYAVMYTALLKSRDDQGRPRYSSEEVGQWMKDVRDFGREQVFRFPTHTL